MVTSDIYHATIAAMALWIQYGDSLVAHCGILKAPSIWHHRFAVAVAASKRRRDAMAVIALHPRPVVAPPGPLGPVGPLGPLAAPGRQRDGAKGVGQKVRTKIAASQ